MTELIWSGKYKDNKKVAPVRIALPFQTIETVNESAADRLKRISSIFSNKTKQTEWRNRLIWGDKKYVLPSLLPEFAGKINLIYIDPPFDTGANFSFKATIPNDIDKDDSLKTEFIKQPSIIEQKAYRDTWGKGLDSYLQWFYETAVLLRELLADDGSIYVHLDWHICHYAKIILDDVFGMNNFINEIIWHYFMGGKANRFFSRKHDNILVYVKSEKYKFSIFEIDRILPYKPSLGSHKELKQIKCDSCKKDSGVYLSTVKCDDVWDISGVFNMSNEFTNYPTQKPEALLERIIKASSNEGDLVLDCFCGSGTTAAMAEKLNRRWIACDLGRFAIHTTRKRLLGIQDLKPFIVQNLGKYERQQWIKAEFENPESRLEKDKQYKKFILELYRADTLDGYVWIHGAKQGRLIHIGGVEAPITINDVKSSIMEFWKLVGKEQAATRNGIDFLGWEFAFEINEVASQFAKSNNVDIKFKKIPREVLEKKAVEQGDIKFYELASLEVKTSVKKYKASLEIENFIIPQDDISDDIRKGITNWRQWIDYWAVDWNYRDDTFHNEWQTYRSKPQPKIELSATNEYEEKGKYVVLVKVIDILGNDTTKTLEVEIL